MVISALLNYQDTQIIGLCHVKFLELEVPTV